MCVAGHDNPTQHDFTPVAGDTMGCASSSQTSAQDTTRPDSKQDGNTPGAGNENGGPAGDTETIPEQTSASPVPSVDVQSSEPNAGHTEEPAPSENTPVEQADPPQEAPASGEDS